MACQPLQFEENMSKPIKLRASVKWFAQRMEQKLRDNDHKDHWSNSSQGYLIGRIADELKELKSAKFINDRIDECTDIANFAMMVADNANHGHRIRPRLQQRTACGPE